MMGGIGSMRSMGDMFATATGASSRDLINPSKSAKRSKQSPLRPKAVHAVSPKGVSKTGIKME